MDNIKNEFKDSTSVDINKTVELQYWTEQFNISEEKLRQAVDQVGTDVTDLKRYLQLR